jgi:hypothetical protein
MTWPQVSLPDRDLARARNQAACRLHAVLCDLVPGGTGKKITAGQAARVLDQATPSGAAGRARCKRAEEFLADIRHLDARLRATRKNLAAVVKTSGTSLTGIFGIGPVIAGTIIGDVRRVSGSPAGTTSPLITDACSRRFRTLSADGTRAAWWPRCRGGRSGCRRRRR